MLVVIVGTIVYTQTDSLVNAKAIAVQDSMPEPYRSMKVIPYKTYLPFSAHTLKHLKQFIDEQNPKAIIELGSSGSSSLSIAHLLPKESLLYTVGNWQNNDNIHYQADMLTIDPQTHEPEFAILTPFQQFVANRDSFKPTHYQYFLSNIIHDELTDIIMPIHMSSIEASHTLDIAPNIIYLNKGGDAETVYNELSHWYFNLAYNGIFCGDGWLDTSVQHAIVRFARERNIQVQHDENFWYLSAKQNVFEQAKVFVGSPGSWWEDVGKFQLQLLQTHGCTPQSKVLEIGCGCLAAGHHIIDFLNPGNFVGIEPNSWLVDAAINEANLLPMVTEKKPIFLSNYDFDASSTGMKFDYIISHSILSHAGFDQLGQFFQAVSKVLEPGGILLASIRLAEQDSGHLEWQYPGVSYFSRETVFETASQYGLTCEERPDIRALLTGVARAHIHDWILARKK